jgi:hypothetical protein
MGSFGLFVVSQFKFIGIGSFKVYGPLRVYGAL